MLVLAGLLANAQTITITSPNGGEVLPGCTQYAVGWNTTGIVSGFYNIDFSINGGLTWSAVATNFQAPSRSFTWTVPNVSTSNGLVRVMDAQNTNVRDLSNNPFTITAPMVLNSPNGGQVWPGQSLQTISWAASSGGSNSFNIDYSTDAGSSWTSIVTNWTTFSNSYSWTVPNTPSTTVLVRVTDASFPCRTDFSDNVFTITPAPSSLNITNPTVGMTWYAGQLVNVTWTNANLPSNFVRIDYSFDNGVSWNLVTASTPTNPSSGSFNWTLPNTPTTQARVRVRHVTDTTISTVSQAFTIRPFVVITSPAGSNQFAGCSNTSIVWSRGGTSNSWNLDYSINGGQNWIPITSNYFTTSSTSVSYFWTIPNTPGTNVVVRVTDANDTTKRDTSNSFTIIRDQSIIVNAPNGGEVWQGGSNRTVSWANQNTSFTLEMLYSTNNGQNWTTISTISSSVNQYTWGVPNIPTTQALFMVRDWNNTCKNDVSDAVFEITAATPTITLTNPTSAVNWYAGQIQTINWNHQFFPNNSFVRLEYSTDGGATWQVIVNSAPAGTSSGSFNWTVPNTPSNSARIRVSLVGNPSISSTSPVNFTLLPFVVLSSPTTAVNWAACSNQSISWNRGGTSNIWRLDYSINGGANWINITNNFNTGSATFISYTWSVPNVPTQALRIRVSDALDLSKSDSMRVNGVILRDQSIIINSPNGGQSWQAASTQQASWASNNVSSTLELSYSTDAGQSWNFITSVSSFNNTYNWTIPNTPSSQALFRVRDWNNACKADTSDAVFAITAPNATITLTNPTSAVSWYAGQNQTISWNCSFLPSNFVRLEYSTDGGLSWLTIVNSTPTNSTSGSYNWIVPNTPSTQARIRVSPVGSPSIQSTSPVNFTLLPFVLLTSPNGGQQFAACGNQSISWSRGGTSNNWSLEYSIDGGLNWLPITSSLFTNSSTNLSYSWSVPNTPTTQGLIRITDNTDTTKRDTSNAVFSIIRDQSLIVNSPNGGEVWQGGTNRVVSWASQNTSSTLELSYSTDAGLSWNTITTVSSFTNQYTWAVPNAPSTNSLFRIRDWNNSCRQDASDGLFTITPANQSFTITNPTSNVSWYAGQIQTISWNNQFIPTNSFVKLEYSTDAGANWITIVNAAPAGSSSGSFNWTVPNAPTTQARIRVSLVGNTAIQAVNPVNFTLLPFIVLTSPTGNLTWPACETRTITWTRGGTSNQFNIEYSNNGGANWLPIANNVNFGSQSNLSYSWVVNNIPTNQFRIRVTDSFDPSKSDTSKNDNTITRNQSIIINTPNGGEQWKGNTVQQISWAANNVSGTLELSYSTDSGISWNFINSASSFNNTFNWTIPNTPSTQALVRVRDWNNACKSDTSNAVFTLTPPDPILTLTSFNSGSTVYAGQVQNISWNNQFLPTNNIRIEYSIDNGQNWSTVVNSTPTNNTSGSFNWTIPNTPTRFGLVRISVVGNGTIQSTSTLPFFIESFVVLTSPNGGENWAACTNRTISWNRGGTSTQWKIEYSLDGGTNWNLITGSHFGSTSVNQSYNWTVPNMPSSATRIRVSDALDATKADSSNGDFSIVQDQSIIVNSPNGGEVWTGGTNRVVSWASNGTSSTLWLFYSTDNGQNWTYINQVSSFTNQYTWTVPNTSSTQAIFRVQDANNSCRNDVSDAVFTILPAVPTFTIISPNGGNTLYTGTLHTINWSSQFVTTNFVRLEYSVDNGNSWTTIVNATSNSGSYNWSVPNTITSQALVRVSDFSNANLLDVSNSVFSISPPIKVLTPNGGEQLFGCAQTTVSWTRGGSSNNFRLEYSIDNGQNWIFIINLTTSSTSPTYNWTLPATGSASYRVRIMDQNDNTRVDVSDTTFTVYAPITLTDPNTGGQWLAGSTRNITWTDTLTSKNYNLDYSINGGSTWTNIVVNQQILNGQYSWTVPSVLTTNGLIRITEFGSSCKQDISNFPFTITQTTNSLTVTSPNGGATYQSCQVLPITWTSVGLNGTVRIEVSYNNGVSWTMIDGSVPVVNGSYNWTIPNTSSNLFLVRITSNIIAVINDVSNAVSTISTPVAQAGNDALLCQGDSVQLGSSGVGTFSWSPVAGLSSATVSNPMASPTSTTTYTLTVTNSFGCSSTDQVKVTVSSKPNLVITGDTVICSGASTQLQASGASTYVWSPTTGISNPNSASPVFTPATSTTYQLIGINNGCTDTAFVRVVVNPSPTSPFINALGATTFCQGDSVFLSSSSTNGNQWYRNGQPMSGETSGILNVKISGSYSVRVSNGSCFANSQVLLVVVNAVPPTPQITANGNLQFCLGGNVVLSSSSSSGNTWLRNNVVISGATSSTFTATTAGNYAVRVSNGQCTATSASVGVNVTPALPTPSVSGTNSLTFCSNDSTILSASDAIGPWRWIRNGNILSEDTLRTLVVKTSGSYAVRIERGGCSATSVAVSITVNPSPTSPTIAASGSLTFCQGDSVTLSSGLNSGLQWLLSGNPISGATSGSLIVKNSGSYTLRQTLSGCSAVSAANVVTVNALPVVPVLTPGFDQSLCDGQSVTLRTTGNFQQYQWQNNLSDLSGQTADSLIVATTGNYRLVVTNAAGCSRISDDVNLTFQPVPNTPVLAAVGSLVFCDGGQVKLHAGGTVVQWYRNGQAFGSPSDTLIVANSGNYRGRVTLPSGCFSESTELTVQVNALPQVPVVNASAPLVQCAGSPLTLSSSLVSGAQWLLNGNPITGAQDSFLVVTATGNYQLNSTNAAGCSSRSLAATVTFNPVPTPATLNASGAVSFCDGGQVILRATGASVTRQWLRDGQTISGAQADTLLATQTGQYQLRLTNSFGCFSNSNLLSVTVNPVPAIPVVSPSGNQIICDGQTLVLKTTSGAVNYEWFRNGNILSGFNADSLVVTQGGNYRVRYSNSFGCTSISVFTNVTVNPNPTVPALQASGNTTFCQGGQVIIKGNPATGTRKWYQNGSLLSGQVSDSLIVQNSGSYELEIVLPTGCSSKSQPTQVVVNPLPVAPVILGSDSIRFCQGDNRLLQTLSGGSLQWLKDGAAVIGATFDTLRVQNSGNYQVRTTDANGCSAISGSVNSQQLSYPTVPVIQALGNTTFCDGGGVLLTANIDGQPQWIFNGNAVSGGTRDTLRATQAGVYQLEVSRLGLCVVNSQNTIITSLLLTPAKPLVQASGALRICSGDSVVLSSSGSANYQWYQQGLPIATAQDSFIVVRQSGQYSVSTQNGICDRMSDTLQVEVFAIPSVPTITAQGSLSRCDGDSLLLRASHNGETLKWYRNGQPVIQPASDSLWVNTTGSYTVESLNGGLCSNLSAAVNTVFNPNPAMPSVQAAGSLTLCQGDSLNLSATATGNIQWMLNGTAITGAQALNYFARISGDYAVQVTNTFGCSQTSSATTVTVNPTPAVPVLNRNGVVSVCQVDRLVLRTTSIDSIQWFRNGQLFTSGTDSVVVTQSGLYQAVAVTTLGCTKASDTVRVFVNPQPIIPPINRIGNLRFCQGGQVVFRVNNLVGFGLQWFRDGQLLSGQIADSLVATSAGIYQLRVQNAAGCQSLNTGDTVVVDALPTAPTVTPTGSINLCQGQNVLLSSNATSGRQWWKDGQPIVGQTADTLRVASSGQYAIRVTNASGCFNTSNAVSVTVSPIPAVPTISAAGPTTFCSGNQVVLRSSSAIGNQWMLNGNDLAGQSADSLIVTLAGNYSVRVTNAGNCSNTSTNLTITVNPTPAVAFVGANGPTTFCQGGQVVLSSSVSQNAVWVLNGQPFVPVSGPLAVVSSGSWAVRVSGGNGCFSFSLPTIVTVNPIPVKPIISRVLDTLISNVVTGNQWFLVGSGPVSGATQQRFLPPQNGRYTLQVSANGCTSPNADTISFIFTTVSEIAANWNTKLFPNPASDAMNLEIEVSNAMSLDASILDVQGKVFRRWEMLGIESGRNQVKVQVEGLADGLYFLRLINTEDGNSKNLRFVIKR